MKMPTAFLGLLFIAGVCALPSANAQVGMIQISTLSAQQATPARVANIAGKTELSGFEVTFTALSQKYQTAFVCESAPYQATLSPVAVAALQKTLSKQSKQSKQDEITAVALAYDYDAVFANDHTVLLTKRYSQPKDLPEITLDEAALYLNNLLKEAAPYADPSDDKAASTDGNTRLSGVIIDLYKAATPEQKAAYAKGVRWGDMPAEIQTKWAYRQSSFSLDLPLDAFWGIACRLNGLRKPNATVFKTVSYFGMAFSAYEGPFRSPQLPDRWEVVLSRYMKTTATGGTAYMPPGHIVMDQGKVKDPLPDPTTPTPEEIKASPKPRPTCQKTLMEMAVDMNARIAKSGAVADNVVHVAFPAAIEEKTISVFGAEAYLSPLEEVKAIGEVYGLRGALGQDGVVTLALPKAIKDVDPTQLWVEGLHALPVPVFRALRGPLPVVPGAKPVLFPPGENDINQNKATGLYIEATKRLRIMVEPKLASLGEGKTLPLADVPSESRSLIALSSLVDVVRMFRMLAQPQAPLTKQIEGRAQQTFKMFQEGNNITYRFSDGVITSGSSFPVPAPQQETPQPNPPQ